jgi:lysozyme family protein
MAVFDDAYPTVFQNEVGDGSKPLDDDPDDPGGLTKYGIILAVIKEEGIDVDGDGDIDLDDIRALTPGTSREVYLHRWNRWNLGSIKGQRVATKIFDLCVNTGWVQCGLFVQRALLAVDLPVKIDGRMGPKTLEMVNIACGNNMVAFGLLAALRSEAAGFYRHLGTKSEYFAKCQNGWLARAYQ